VSPAQPNVSNRLGRRLVVVRGTSILVAASVAAVTGWYILRESVDLLFQSAAIGAEHACEPVPAAPWSVGGKSDRTWAITTNLASCDDVRQRVSGLAGKGLVEISREPNLRCTAAAIVEGRVLSGICYAAGSTSPGFFAWGADVPPYDRPAPCKVCSGVPGEISVPAGKSSVP
jgi:hypothetical protein